MNRQDFEIAMDIINRLGKLPYAPENLLLTDWAKQEYTSCVIDAADLLSDLRKNGEA
jgi:hypothetical protein